MKNFLDKKTIAEDETWPEAIVGNLICDDTEVDKIDRANSIVDFFLDTSCDNKKVLDFGCGEGHVSNVIKKSKISVGYDLEKSGNYNWENLNNNILLTTDFSKVEEHAPYDIIILYDVIDHCLDLNNLFEKIKKVSSHNTQIYLRCHPWFSRHGGHLYKSLNKAYAHLFMENESLINNFNYIQYNNMFIDNDFIKIKEEYIESEVEKVFLENQFLKDQINLTLNLENDFCFKKYKHYCNGVFLFDLILLSNGLIYNSFKISPTNKWEITSENKATFKWGISEENPSGKFKDYVKFNDKGYEGENKSKQSIKGTLVKDFDKYNDILSKSFIDYILKKKDNPVKDSFVKDKPVNFKIF